MSKKTISINPELFNISSFDSNTRKKRPGKSDTKPKIKVRSKEKPKNNKTLKQNNKTSKQHDNRSVQVINQFETIHRLGDILFENRVKTC